MNTKSWSRWGVYLGYPSCCVDEFIQHITLGTSKTRPKRKLHGTGYVPCAKCNNKTTKELLITIASRRLCSTPFPHEHIAKERI